MNGYFTASIPAYSRLVSLVTTDIPSTFRYVVGLAIIAAMLLLLICSFAAGCIALYFSDPPTPISRNHALIRRVVLLFKWAFGVISPLASGILGYVIGANFDQVKTSNDLMEAMRTLVNIPVDLFVLVGYVWCIILIIDLTRLTINGNLRVAYNRFFEKVFYKPDAFGISNDQTLIPPEQEDRALKSVRWFLTLSMDHKVMFIFMFGAALLATWNLGYEIYGSSAIKSFLDACLS